MFDSPRAAIPECAPTPPGLVLVPAAGAGRDPGGDAARDLIRAARALADVARGAGGWPATDRVRTLAELDVALGSIAVARSRILAAEEAAPGCVRPGDRDVVDARARLSRTGLGAARREVHLARALDAMPAVCDAVGAGRMPVAHAEALARTAARTGDVGRTALASTQTDLVALASSLPVREFAAAAERVVAQADPEQTERDHEAGRRRRFLVLSHQADGTHVRGLLDRVSGSALRTALDAVGCAPDETRTKEQADADALVALAERAVAGTAGVRRVGRPVTAAEAQAWDAEQRRATELVSGSAVRPVVSVVVPAAAVAALQARHGGCGGEAQSQPVVGAPVVGLPDMGRPGTPELDGRAAAGQRADPATLEDGAVLPGSVLARFLCDSEIGRVVLGADSVPLDLGRTSRLFSAAQRRAVVVRDRGCTWNGCAVPAAYAQVHHIRWWDRDRGATDLANAALLCSFHHHTVHREDLVIERAGPPRRLAGGWVEPQRYRFRARGGAVVNGPPTDADPDGRSEQPVLVGS